MSNCAPEIVTVSLARGNKPLPRLEDIPIPLNCQINRYWPPLMEELADHIGVYETVQIAQTFPGQTIYVPMDPALSPFTKTIGAEKAAIMAHVFGRERLNISAMNGAIRYMRMCQLAVLVNAGKITLTEAAKIAAFPIRHMSTFVNSGENFSGYQVIDLPEPREIRMLRAATDIAEQVMRELKLSGRIVYAMRDRIMALANAQDLPLAEDDEPENQLSAPVGV